MDGYELELETFRGPLEKLLELIEAKELEITQLSLADVTADFLDYVRSLDEIDPRALADFVAVAARLILIKSRAILPNLELTEEEEEDIAELERRLKLYKEFRAVEKSIEKHWQRRIAYQREYLSELPEGFYLNEPVSPSDLALVMERIHREISAFIPKAEETEIKLVSLEEMIGEMIARVDKAARTSFNDMAEGKERHEVIVLFLALLHLLKDSAINIEQTELYSEIHITKNNE